MMFLLSLLLMILPKILIRPKHRHFNTSKRRPRRTTSDQKRVDAAAVWGLEIGVVVMNKGHYRFKTKERASFKFKQLAAVFSSTFRINNQRIIICIFFAELLAVD